MNHSMIPPFQLQELKLNNDSIDEESNNGPLDFSLHRGVGLPIGLPEELCIAMKNSNADRGRRRSYSDKPRVKLTLRETSEQRERRLHKGRERMRRLRANETFEERQIRLLKARECQERRRKKERELETSEERERRLAVARDRTRERRKMETPEQREKRLKATRERLRWKRMSETPEERQKRLNSQRDKKRQKYHYLTSDDKEVYKSRKPKIEADAEKRQTRGINFKYDMIDDDLDEALWQFQSSDPPTTNSPEEIRWLAEPEVCLSVDSTHAFSPGKSNNENDSTQPANFTGGTNASTAGATVLPPPQQIHEQISEHVSNLVMNNNDPSSDDTNTAATTSATTNQLTNNQNEVTSDFQNIQQQQQQQQSQRQDNNEFEQNCHNHIAGHSLPPHSDGESVQCNNNSEITKRDSYPTHSPVMSMPPQQQQQPPQYPIMNRVVEPRLQYEQNLSAYNNVVSSESSQMRPCIPSQELCNNQSVSSHMSHSNTNLSLYSHAAMSHAESPLNLHTPPNFIYPRYASAPFPSIQKHNASMYLNYPTYNLPPTTMEEVKNKNMHLHE